MYIICVPIIYIYLYIHTYIHTYIQQQQYDNNMYLCISPYVPHGLTVRCSNRTRHRLGWQPLRLHKLEKSTTIVNEMFLKPNFYSPCSYGIRQTYLLWTVQFKFYDSKTTLKNKNLHILR